MRASEFVVEDASTGATAAGSVASVTMPMDMNRRATDNFFHHKYSMDQTDLTPNTPAEYKKLKRKNSAA